MQKERRNSFAKKFYRRLMMGGMGENQLTPQPIQKEVKIGDLWGGGGGVSNFASLPILRYQPPFRTVRAPIAIALVVFIKTPLNHIFFKSLIIPDYGFELTKTIYLNVFRNWNALCKCTRLYKSCSTPAGNKRRKTINTAFASQHVPLKNRVSDF